MKTLPPLDPATPMAKAAQVVIGHHLARLRHELEQIEGSAARPDKEVRESVHQARVISRRLAAAIGAFSEFLAPRFQRKLKKRLRRLRQMAAPARALDVLNHELERLLESGTPETRDILEPMHAWLEKKRARALHALARSLESKKDKYAKQFRPKDFRNPPARTLGDAMPEALGGLVTGVLNSGTTFDYSGLHRLRIAGKRLRYTLEIFACCQDPDELQLAQSCVETLQKRLGDINDCHEFAAWMHRLASKPDAGKRQAAAQWLAEHFEKLKLQKSRQFQDEWTKSLRPTLEHWSELPDVHHLSPGQNGVPAT